MATLIAALVLVHLTAFACVLLMARYSVVLVDDMGRPLHVTPWQEQRIPAKATLPAEAPEL